MRTSFINQLLEEAKINKKIFLVIGDLGYHVVEPFMEAIPERFLNAGIAEQNMAGVAAGLAMTGYNVYIYSIGNFPTLRCLEQIRNDIAYHKANVKIVSVGAGYAYGSLGATHQPTEEIGALRAIPNMIVATPGDPVEARAIAKFSAEYNGPMYIRLGKAGEKVAHSEESLTLSAGDILPVLLDDGNKKAVLACGNILAAAKAQIEEQELPYDLFSVPFVKPLNKKQLKAIVEKHPAGMISIEEHQASTGMGSAIVEQVSDMYAAGELKTYPAIKRVAIPDEFAPVVGTQTYLREYEGLKIG
jgi:transketolase